MKHNPKQQWCPNEEPMLTERFSPAMSNPFRKIHLARLCTKFDK